MVDGGAVAFTDHDRPIVSADIMRRALEYCRMFDKPVLCHAEDPDLTRGGIMHEGALSMRLGLRGMPAAAEEIVLYRDLELAALTGGRLHVLSVSTAGSVELIRRAKERGVRVTAETTPYHLLLTEEMLHTFDSNYKLNPPLRDQADALQRSSRDWSTGRSMRSSAIIRRWRRRRRSASWTRRRSASSAWRRSCRSR